MHNRVSPCSRRRIILLAHVPQPDPRLSDADRVIAPDYPAFGHSAVPDRSAFGYTFDHLADVVDGLLGQLGIGKFAIYVMDFGAPVDGFFARQPPHLREILVELRSMVEAAAPEATGSIKWGMPFFGIGGEMLCALGAHRAHVNRILPGPPGTYADPEGLLEGEGRTGKHL